MMVKTYLIQHRKQPRFSFVFKYSLKGLLYEFKSGFKMNHAQLEYVRDKIPFIINDINNFGKDREIEFIDNGLTFNTFWDTYNYKLGNKKKAEQLFKQLSETDKAKAISYISKYDNTLKLTSISKAHATTYLNQR